MKNLCYNKCSMKKCKVGFTLIEVVLFLGVTSLLFLSVTIGVQSSIYQQRYTDTIQSFADFLGNMYSEVLNVQSSGDGKSDKAIYGKLVVFPGENGAEQVVKVYDVIGNAGDGGGLGNDDTLALLKKLDVGIETGVTDEYKPKWGARIQKIGEYVDYSGSVLIVRDPKSGTVQTYVSNSIYNGEEVSGMFANSLGNFGIVEVDFCINPDGNVANDRRADVRLAEGTRNRSGVGVVALDSDENKCN